MVKHERIVRRFENKGKERRERERVHKEQAKAADGKRIKKREGTYKENTRSISERKSHVGKGKER